MSEYVAIMVTCAISLRDALPIWDLGRIRQVLEATGRQDLRRGGRGRPRRPRGHSADHQNGPEADEGDHAHHAGGRSEEHTSELQSRLHLVCRLPLEKKKKQT